MSLVSEEKRAELEKLSTKEMKKRGLRKPSGLKTALKKEIFYILAENSPKRAMKILQKRGRKLKLKMDDENFLEFLREFPASTIEDVKKAGYGGLLASHYGGKINLAKEKAGISEEYRYKRGAKPKIRDLKAIIYGLILSSNKPLYSNEIAEIIKRSNTYVQDLLRELYIEGKIEYRNILPFSTSKRYRSYALFNGSWKKFGVKKLVYDPNNFNHLNYMAREISNSIVQSFGNNITPNKKRALTRRLKLLPENLRKFVIESLPYY
ncbi:MAG: hypothetical protein QXP77_03100 [Candidatus Aenigmatarchaeota archaeon]